jgi:hypothetical protein
MMKQQSFMILGLLIACLSAWSTQLHGQNETDVFRYSFTESLGSTRTMGMGGAFGALGADLACLTGNPAGIGLYRRGDASLTTGFASQKTRLNVSGQFGDANQISGSTTNLGIALTYPSVNPDWPVSTLAISVSRRANFNEKIEIEDALLGNSLLDVFLGQAQGSLPGDLYTTGPFTSNLAWETFLLDPNPNGNPTSYVSAIPSGGAYATKKIERSGKLNETNIAFGSNYRERLCLGISLGIVNATFDETAIHSERPQIDTLQLNTWEFQERLNVEGSGLNVKLGMQYALSPWLRMGLAYHTRTRIAFTDEYSTNMRSELKSGESYDYNSPLNRLEYVIYTPSRAMASLAFIMGKYGVISADYERVNYGSGNLRPTALSGPDAYKFENENETMASLYGLSHCARVGAEIRIQRAWRLRAGAGLETSPYQPAAEIQTDSKRYTGSLGFGYRTEKWYASSTYRRSQFERDIYLFDPGLLDAGRMRQSHGMLVAAFGFRL